MDMIAASSAAAKKYEVFLSFRGDDTRHTFTSLLHRDLQLKKIETYIDDRLEAGDEIGPALVEAIRTSKISVIVFSQNYASSTWCLDELVHILECKETNGQLVVPIFYNVNPSHVRKQEGSYADAFARLEKRFKDNMDKVHEWRDALEEACSLCGFHSNFNQTCSEANFLDKVVKDIWTKLIRESSSNLKGLVGMETRIEEIELLLCVDGSPEVFHVGIWGMGGIGKTTLADAVFHRNSSKFEASCFLTNVREDSGKHGLLYLRNVLLRKILREPDLDMDTPSVGSTFVRERLSRLKVLIVLDDVNDSEQIEHLVGDNISLGPGSRIIITTRNRSLLKNPSVGDDKIYPFRGLNFLEALDLFCQHAFKNRSPTRDYTELSNMVVAYAEGNPLALKLLGSSFLCKSKEDWEAQLHRMKEWPDGKIPNSLRLSYDGLEENEKNIFLDLACFFKGMKRDFVESMLVIRGFSTTGIKILIDMSLISIGKWGGDEVHMHDMVQEMGRSIEEKAGDERKRLFDAKEICRALKEGTLTDKIEAISFNVAGIGEIHLSRADLKKMRKLRWLRIYHSLSGIHVKSSSMDEIREVQLSSAALEKMCNLRWLRIYHSKISNDLSSWINHSGSQMNCKFYLPQGRWSLPKALRYLHWERCPFRCLPPELFTENLVEIHFPSSELEQLNWNTQNLVNIKVINLRSCKRLTEVADLSCCEKLTILNLECCSNLKYLPELPKNIESLLLRWSGIQEFPSSSSNCLSKISSDFSLNHCSSLAKIWELPKNITKLDISDTAIEELPSSIECLFGLTAITLRNCQRFVNLPPSICKLQSLEKLSIVFCSKFEYFPEIEESMEHLWYLDLHETAVKVLPTSIYKMYNLRSVNLSKCTRLQNIPEVPGNLVYLNASDCTSLTTVSSSRIALAQDMMNEHILYGSASSHRFLFDNCLKLDKKALGNIMDDSYFRIMRMAHTYHTDMRKYGDAAGRIIGEQYVGINCPGNEIPNWFMYQNDGGTMNGASRRIIGEQYVGLDWPGNAISNWFMYQRDGCTMNIKLPPDYFRPGFLGFAFCLVVTYENHPTDDCKFYAYICVNTNNGESPRTDRTLWCSDLKSDSVFIWYKTGGFSENIVKFARSAECCAEFEVSVAFAFGFNNLLNPKAVKFKRCGIHPLFSEDAEKIKSDVLSEERKAEEGT